MDSEFLAALLRIEEKLDILVDALLTEEEQDVPAFDLDGNELGGQREPGTPL